MNAEDRWPVARVKQAELHLYCIYDLGDAISEFNEVGKAPANLAQPERVDNSFLCVSSSITFAAVH